MILGIDTSNYTTSVAVVSLEQQLLFDQRKVLAVAAGERGLQQSVAVFQHVQNLPAILPQALAKHREGIRAVVYSAKPRPLTESYMPVFRTGEGFAETVGAALGVPVYQTTHQEGHVMAGLWSAGFVPQGPFLAMHLSGGTTDLLLIEPRDVGFAIETLGSSSDLHAGQLVDRIGVKLGLPFPAGPALEKLALTAVDTAPRGENFVLPSSVKGYTISFSGPCSAAERQIDAGVESGVIAFAVLRNIAKSVEKVLTEAIRETGVHDILFVGGVAANSIIKERLLRQLSHPAIGGRLYFASPEYSRDNSVGVALLGRKYFMGKPAD